MRIAVVIVNYRTPEMVLTCLDALAGERAAVSGLRVVVVDNASPDHSATFLATHLAADAYAGWVEFLPLPLNGGFAWGNNQAILSLVQADAPADAILLLNPDAVIQPGALGALVRDMEARADAGAVGSQLINPDGTLSGSAFRFPSIGSEFVRGTGLAKVGRVLGIKPTMVPFGEVGPVDWLTGASVLIRVEALRQAGLFDTGFFLYFEEVELMH
ncbi:MAG TPA: glycosyltransferase family 2 protein, partial [Novosphingobium sp.]